MTPEQQAQIAENIRSIVSQGGGEPDVLAYLKIEGFDSREAWLQAISAGGQPIPAVPGAPTFREEQPDAATFATNEFEGVRPVESFVRGAKDVGQGIQQLAMMAGGLDAEGFTEQVNADRAEFNERAGPGFNLARLAGNAVATLPASAAIGPASLISRLAGAGPTITRLMGSAAAGAAGGGAQFAPSGTAAEKMIQTGTG